MKKLIIGNEIVFEDFDKLFLTYYSRLRRFVMDFSLSQGDADDIVQDIFTKIWGNWDDIKTRTNVPAYLFSITRNKCIDYIRHKMTVRKYKAECVTKLNVLQSIGEIQDNILELESMIDNAIESLPPRCKEIFIKSRFESMSYKEIALALGISESTVENQIGIALKRLREELKDYFSVFLFFI